MSKGNTFENDLLLLLFNNTDIADIGDAAGIQNSATAGSLYIALHTADPGEAGTAATNETAYSNYNRVAVARSGAGWTVSGNSVTNAAQITFPQCGASGATITHVSITVGGTPTSATKILYSGALNSPLAVALNITPLFAASGLTVTED
jgi:hypothetical protein